MNKLHRTGVALLQVDAGNTAVIDLTEELPEVRAALMPDPRLGEETGLIACLDDAVGEVDVLTEAHLRETAQLQIDITTDAHVIGTGIELVELGLTASDAT